MNPREPAETGCLSKNKPGSSEPMKNSPPRGKASLGGLFLFYDFVSNWEEQDRQVICTFPSPRGTRMGWPQVGHLK